ncbi:hypothetical protein RP20_CCG024249 [Aedes albopictus]|nr:hypothetical protein RP20_CCG024249 [Aedes albopictus]
MSGSTFGVCLLSCTVYLIFVVGQSHQLLIEDTVSRHGYPVEKHQVVTSDGYMLTLVRIPKPGRRPALMVHGMVYSSAEWCIYGKQSLAMRVYDAGFDVWLPNCRGNTFSLKHTKLDVRSEKYWDFSFHEVGLYDLSALFDYVLRLTGFSKLHYVGHSQGTTSFLALNCLQPQYGDKVQTAHLLAPAAIMLHTYSPLSWLLIARKNEIKLLAKMTNNWQMFPHDDYSPFFGASMSAYVPPELFLMVMYSFGGMRSVQLNNTVIRKIMETVPAGASLKQLEHYGQIIASGKFHQYDYGKAGNVERYNATSPPEYRLENVRAPVALYYSENDWFVDPKDVQLLKTKLTNVIFDYRVTVPEFNHLDFLFDQAAVKIYDEIIHIIMASEKET